MTDEPFTEQDVADLDKDLLMEALSDRAALSSDQAEQVFAAMLKASVEQQKQRALGIHMAALRLDLYKEHVKGLDYPNLQPEHVDVAIGYLKAALKAYARALLEETL